MNEIEAAATRSQESRLDKETLGVNLDQVEDDEDEPDHLYMELKSTATFKDIDIDALVETTSFDQFMAGIYTGNSPQYERKE